MFWLKLQEQWLRKGLLSINDYQEYKIVWQNQLKRQGLNPLNIELPDNIAEGTYQVVIVMNPQTDNELDDYETPDEEAIEGIREGLKQAFSNQTIPLSQMWEGIDVEESMIEEFEQEK